MLKRSNKRFEQSKSLAGYLGKKSSSCQGDHYRAPLTGNVPKDVASIEINFLAFYILGVEERKEQKEKRERERAGNRPVRYRARI